jgi:hypothetical protein
MTGNTTASPAAPFAGTSATANGGARLVLTQTGPAELADQSRTFHDAWRELIESLATNLKG